MSLSLVTKEAGKVSAYIDSALFYVGKGPDTKKRPYGIIDDGNEEPFKLTFDDSGLTVSIGPGMCHIYGRQVELDESQEIYDFHSTAQSRDIYCNVYMEVNLADLTDQRARIVMVMSGAGFEPETNQSQDDLFKRKNGVFRAPINHFVYHPNSNQPFTDYGYDMEKLDKESRYATDTLRAEDKIDGSTVSSITETFSDGSKTKLKFTLPAHNSSALAEYEKETAKNTNSPGYSVADETEAIGVGANAVQIGEGELSNLLTVDTVRVCEIGTGFGRPAGNFSLTHKIDWERLQSIRVWFTKGSGIECNIKYRAKEVISFGAYVESSAKPASNFMTEDYFLAREDFEEQKKAMFRLYGSYTTYGWGNYSVDLEFLRTTSETPGSNDGYLQTVGTPIASYQGSTHQFGLLKIEGNTISMANVGDTQEYSQYLSGLNWAWWQYFELDVTSGQGAMYIDFIYKGGVKLK